MQLAAGHLTPLRAPPPPISPAAAAAAATSGGSTPLGAQHSDANSPPLTGVWERAVRGGEERAGSAWHMV